MTNIEKARLHAEQAAAKTRDGYRLIEAAERVEAESRQCGRTVEGQAVYTAAEKARQYALIAEAAKLRRVAAACEQESQRLRKLSDRESWAS